MVVIITVEKLNVMHILVLFSYEIEMAQTVGDFFVQTIVSIQFNLRFIYILFLTQVKIFILINVFIFLEHRPKSGSMLLYSRKKVRYRRDGYCWKKRKDGKTTREDHMKLKVQGTEVSLN